MPRMKPTRRLLLGIFFSILVVGVNSMVALASTAPGLGTAASYAILAGTTVTNTGNSVIAGDIGISPGSACTGFPAPCTGGGPGTLSGAIHAGDAQALQAKSDLTAAYGVAASSPCNFNKTGVNLGGQTLTPGTPPRWRARHRHPHPRERRPAAVAPRRALGSPGSWPWSPASSLALVPSARV